MGIPADYPPADVEAQWFFEAFPGTFMPVLEKLLLHTTEGSSWPDYDGGAKAPHLTYHPVLHRWRQHLPLNHSARALQDPTSTPVRENRDGVVQVEIICSSDPAYAEKHGLLYVADLDDHALVDLATFAAWLHTNAGLLLQKAPVWLPYPASGSDKSKARMTSAQFDAFKGICGHEHASGNDHGDPGAIAINQILAIAGEIVDGKEGCEMTKEQAAQLLATLSRIEAILNGMNARTGYLANDMAKDVDAMRDEIVGPD